MLKTLMTTVAVLALSIPLAGAAQAQSLAGPYLAARQASVQSDFAAAIGYYERALVNDPENIDLLERATVTYISLGRVDQAVTLGQRIADLGQPSQVAQMALTADRIKRGAFDEILSADGDAERIGPLIDGLIRAWALMGRGEANDALAAFDTISSDVGLQGFALFQKALALAMVGDFETAAALFDGDEAGIMSATRRGALVRAEILSQLDRNDEALAMLDEVFAGNTDPELDLVIAALKADEEVPFRHIRTVQDGFAEVFYTIAAALSNEAGPEYTLLYAQIARTLRPDHIDAILMTAELFEQLNQHDLAIDVYRQVPPADPAYHAAELGRAAALRRSGKPAAAIEVLEQLTRSHGDMAIVQSSLGDILRQQESFAEAIAAYDAALANVDAPSPSQWFLFYARGIAKERLGDMAGSEADFRKALDLNPDQPQVLNYLGYSLVEQNTKLEEALGMIERAAAGSPDSGYIIDSLGWAFYRLGRYADAVPQMERAVELMAVDPVVNDHLGDVYWAVGRKREAEFQWARALSFVDEKDADGEADPDRIRRKLEVGLDAVLKEEGKPSLKVAKDE